MGTIIKADDLITAIKTGLSKVKDATASISSEKGKVRIVFKGSAVTYSHSIAGEGKSFPAYELDIANLNKLIASHASSDIDLSVDGNEFTIKRGRSKIKVPCSSHDSFMSDSTDEAITNDVETSDMFRGWVKNHPLKSAASLKRAIQSIKDNVTKTELIVEAEWGKSDFLKVKIVDQFHGILAVVKLAEVPMKKKVRICVPLSSFINLLDMTGDLYVDPTKVIVKNDDSYLECRFIAGSAFGTIDDMMKIFKSIDTTLTTSAKELNAVVKKISSVSEADDSITLRYHKKNLQLESATSKAEILEVIEAEGKLANSFKLSPKNLLDITSCLVGSVAIGDEGHSVVFKSKKDDISINAAIVKMEV